MRNNFSESVLDSKTLVISTCCGAIAMVQRVEAAAAVLWYGLRRG